MSFQCNKKKLNYSIIKLERLSPETARDGLVTAEMFYNIGKCLTNLSYFKDSFS